MMGRIIEFAVNVSQNRSVLFQIRLMLCLKRFHRQRGKGDLLLTQHYSFLKMFVFSAKLIVSLDLFLQSEVNLNYLVMR